MTLQLVLMVSVGLALLAWSRGGEARVRLNSIRTVILGERLAAPVNRSLWEPSMDLTLYQCMSDLECTEGSYCHTSTKGPSHSRCQACRRRKRRCQRDSMCCPGNRCSNNTCVADMDIFASQRTPPTGPQSKKKQWRKRKRMNARAQPGDSCLRSSDCSAGLCCARHFWTRICKPVLREGQVCTQNRQKRNQGLELFQRCPCGSGLSCQPVREPGTKSSLFSSSLPSSLMAAAAKSKFAASSSSYHHSSINTSSLPSQQPAAKLRLHVCHKV